MKALNGESIRGRVSVLALLGASALAAPAYGADYYVDGSHPQADDGNPGSEDQPWATIQHGADTAAPGDTVYVKEGDYVERVRLQTPGEAGNLIQFIATPRRSVLMHGFTIDEADYVRIEGFEITAHDQFTEWDETQGFFVGGSYVEIVDNYIHNMPSVAINGYWHDPFPVGVTVADNSIYNIQMGIGITGTDWVVEGNEIDRLYQYGAGDCDYMRFFGTGHVIRRNYMHGTSFDEIGDAHVDCFQTFTNNGEEIRDILFDGNVCHDFHQGLMASNVSGTDTHSFTFTNNIFAHGESWGICVHDVNGITLLNNTFYDIAYHGAGFRGASTGNVARNNIFAYVSTSYWGDEGGEVTGDYNLTFEAGDPSAPGANDLLGVDPLFIDPDADDLRIPANSPAVDAGDAVAAVTTDIAGTARPWGAGWDIGAWEYTDAPPLMIVTMTLPEGDLDVPYSASLEADGGTAPYGWSLAEGALPEGLELDAGSGAISGTPTRGGMASFVAQVTDDPGDTATRSLSISVRGAHVITPGEGGEDDSGCGCVTAGRSSSSAAAGAFFALAALALCRWRRGRL